MKKSDQNKNSVESMNTIKPENIEKKKSWIKRKLDFFVKSFKSLLMQGLSSSQIASALALGFAAGTFPILGTHTIIAIGFAFLFRLNQLAVYLGTWLSAPLYFILLLPSLRTGEYIFKADPMNMDLFLSNLKELAKIDERFFDIWLQYGKSILHIVIGWVPLTIGVCVLIYFITYYIAKFTINKTPKKPARGIK